MLIYYHLTKVFNFDYTHQNLKRKMWAASFCFFDWKILSIAFNFIWIKNKRFFRDKLDISWSLTVGQPCSRTTMLACWFISKRVKIWEVVVHYRLHPVSFCCYSTQYWQGDIFYKTCAILQNEFFFVHLTDEQLTWLLIMIFFSILDKNFHKAR